MVIALDIMFRVLCIRYCFIRVSVWYLFNTFGFATTVKPCKDCTLYYDG